MRRILAVLTAVAAAAALAVPVPSFAVSGYLTTFRSTYPAAAGSRIDSCSLCHTAVPTRNAYGSAWSAAGRSYTAINGQDSDGDGFTNLQEITALTFPGNAADVPAGGGADTTAPSLTAFAIPATASSLTVPITTLTATDNVGVTGYLVKENATTPAATATGWTASAPTSFTFAAAGAHTLYAWAKDAAGNVSASRSAAVTITLPPAPDTTPPTLSAFAVPATASSLTVAITTFTATDNVAVTGYLVNETSTTPSPAAPGWTATAPASFTFAAAGAHTLYAWARDAAGNVSASRSATVTITLPPAPDTAAPTVDAFVLPATATSLTVNISALTASDNVGVTAYLLTETSAAPSPTAPGWTGTAPTSYTFATAGAQTLYAWARDAAGNVSTSRSATVTITLPPAPDATAPTVLAFSIPAAATSLTVGILDFTASDNVGVTGYLLNESGAAPAPGDPGWTAAAPTSYTFAAPGDHVLHAFAKDAAGNVSTGLSAAVTITLPTVPDPLLLSTFANATGLGDADWDNVAGRFGGVRGAFVPLGPGRNVTLAGGALPGLAPLVGGRIELKVRLSNPLPGTRAEVLFDYVNARNYRYVRLDNATKRLYIGQVGTVGGQPALRATSVRLPRVFSKLNLWHRLRIDIHPLKNTVQVYADSYGKPALSAIFWQTGVGRVGLTASAATRKVAFDNVTVWDASILP